MLYPSQVLLVAGIILCGVGIVVLVISPISKGARQRKIGFYLAVAGTAVVVLAILSMLLIDVD